MSAALNLQIQTVRQCRNSRKIEATQSRTKNWAFRSFFSFLSFFSLHARFPSSSIDLCRDAFSYSRFIPSRFNVVPFAAVWVAPLLNQMVNSRWRLGAGPHLYRFETQTSQKCPSPPQKKGRVEGTFLSTNCFITHPHQPDLTPTFSHTHLWKTCPTDPPFSLFPSFLSALNDPPGQIRFISFEEWYLSLKEFDRAFLREFPKPQPPKPLWFSHFTTRPWGDLAQAPHFTDATSKKKMGNFENHHPQLRFLCVFCRWVCFKGQLMFDAVSLLF